MPLGVVPEVHAISGWVEGSMYAKKHNTQEKVKQLQTMRWAAQGKSTKQNEKRTAEAKQNIKMPKANAKKRGQLGHIHYSCRLLELLKSEVWVAKCRDPLYLQCYQTGKRGKNKLLTQSAKDRKS